MATKETNPGPVQLPTQAPTVEMIGHAGALERWHQRSAERKSRGLASDRSRRVHAQWLRRTANRANDSDAIRSRAEALLHYRAAAVRTDLLELATMLERTDKPDAGSMATLHELLANGCDSPLYNERIPVCELHATIDRVRAGLAPRQDA
jgi:hypothetical protein